ncbi:hypothetical protein CDD81_7955 [Ophiocordyceps australis]|uniref:DNA repair protein rhp7 treble clef domain-containing protein n=1 Tax=Ophiocordyceps australis TaxID=1399860 RepID=A0A2C5Y4J5_9HYPO|nr:hypothetical protein CDD81_7955 [Ophiocordyceps australis]
MYLSRNITGPQSALTDFLASHNISARQIREDAELRRRRAEAETGDSQLQTDETEAPQPAARRASRRVAANTDDGGFGFPFDQRTLDAAKTKKAIRAYLKRKKAHPDDDEDEEIELAISESKGNSMPGQMENCAHCGKRFTVTPYSVAAPEGGLLCVPCGKELARERHGQPKKKARKQTGGIGSRRALQSRILDGDVGTKSLATLCVHTLAKNVDMADSLGDLPDHLVDKIARLFSKRRLLKSETLPLFVHPATHILHIYDGAKLGEEDFMSIFQTASKLRHFKARCAIQFKDEVMDYLLSRNIVLESFYLHGANLLSEEKWHEFFAAKGNSLQRLQVYCTDKHFGDESITTIAKHCPSLLRLKVEQNQKLTDKGVEAMAELSSLQHLGMQLHNSIGSAALCKVVSSIGPKLKTLSLKRVPHADDTVLQAIHEHCRDLKKLRITESEIMTDKGFQELFTDWANTRLRIVDLEKCRHVDAAAPRINPLSRGLCSEGFKALMAHSGSKLENINVHACRHISGEAFEEVFGPGTCYPELRKLEISFCEQVTDFILGCIFRACPKIREVNVFGCMKVKDVRVPRGVILVGVPNAQGMITEGE